eukprot:gene15679-biopygen11246
MHPPGCSDLGLQHYVTSHFAYPTPAHSNDTLNSPKRPVNLERPAKSHAANIHQTFDWAPSTMRGFQGPLHDTGDDNCCLFCFEQPKLPSVQQILCRALLSSVPMAVFSVF